MKCSRFGCTFFLETPINIENLKKNDAFRWRKIIAKASEKFAQIPLLVNTKIVYHKNGNIFIFNGLNKVAAFANPKNVIARVLVFLTSRRLKCREIKVW